MSIATIKNKIIAIAIISKVWINAAVSFWDLTRFDAGARRL